MVSLTARGCLTGIIASYFLAGSAFPADDIEFFENRIRPALVKYCYECHSAAAAKLKGGLRLDSRAAVRRGGESGPAVVPGDVDGSLLVDAVRHESFEMPPGKKLPANVIADLVRWVEMGAPDPRNKPPSPSDAAGESWPNTLRERRNWWSLQPIRSPTPPSLRQDNWSLSPLDKFILARLRQADLQPAPPAEPQTLLRRLSFVLTGLPPSAEVAAAFPRRFASQPQAAVEQLVDQLLDSPHFGERFARHWMDVIRYTDTYGYEWDIPAKGSWRFRDYLIRAFNDDVGFDQLVREHVAGDLVSTPRVDSSAGRNESLIGPMFFHFGEHRHGDSLNFNGIHQEMLNNKIDAFSKALLATTVACARCHDHKLDAVSQRDYYALASVITTPRWTPRVIDTPGLHQAAVQQLQRLRAMIRSAVADRWKAAAAAYPREIVQALEPGGSSPASDASSSSHSKLWRRALQPQRRPHEQPSIEQVIHPVAQLLLAAEKARPLRQAWNELAARWRTERQQRVERNSQNFELLDDFRQPDLPAGWTIEGDGLRHGYVGEGTPWIALEGPAIVRRLLYQGYHTGSLSSRLPGSLRTPRLPELGSAYFSVLLAGSEWSGHITIPENAFLTERVAFLHQPDEPRWHQFSTFDNRPDCDVRTEFVTTDLNPNFPPRTGLARAGSLRLPDEDFGVGKRSWFSIRRIVTHDRPGAPQDTLDCFAALYEQVDHSPVEGRASATHSAASQGSSPAATGAELEFIGQRIGGWLSGAVERWADNDLRPGDVRLVNWLLSRGLLPNDLGQDESLQRLVCEYRAIESTIAPPRTVNSMDERSREPLAYPWNIRGNVDDLGAGVPRDFLQVFAGKHGVADSAGSGRQELAEFLLGDQNPLTARVYVNRVWGWLFGRGIVATPNDFGHLGQLPSHPDLLDYLAHGFVAQDWSTKRLVRRIVLSQTFRQSGRADELARDVDPSNRLRHSYALRRLEAEAIRDTILAVSGRLERRLFGPPLDPPRAREHPEKRLYSGPLDGDGRRSIYTRMTIMEPPKLLAVFNQPSPKIPTGLRDVTNVPSQALVMLNDPFVAAQAERWAESLLQQSHGTAAERIRSMFLSAFGRAAADHEIALWQSAVESFAEESHETGVMSSRFAWTQAAHAIFNAKEFIYYR